MIPTWFSWPPLSAKRVFSSPPVTRTSLLNCVPSRSTRSCQSVERPAVIAWTSTAQKRIESPWAQAATAAGHWYPVELFLAASRLNWAHCGPFITGMRRSACWAPAWVSYVMVVLDRKEHTSELQSQSNLVCRLLLEKKKVYRSYPLIQIHLLALSVHLLARHDHALL